MNHPYLPGPSARDLRARHWMDDAACAYGSDPDGTRLEGMEVDPDLWYADSPHDQFEAVQICVRCKVRPECLRYALKHDEKFGIWGGFTTAERAQMLKRRVS